MVDKKDTGPLTWNVAIVEPKTGYPTVEFQRRWNTQRLNNALLGTVTFADAVPEGAPEDGALYVDTSTDPGVLYIGEDGEWLQVGSATFLELQDTPDTYTAQGDKLVRVNPGATALTFDTLSDILDSIDNTQGVILYRGAAGWVALAPGTDGQVLTTHGAGADPTWETLPP